MLDLFKDSAKRLKEIRTLTGSSLLIAIAVIIDFFRLVLSNVLEISFGFIALAMAGLIYGPVVGGLVGGISDIIQYIVRPSGPFFPGFTLNSILAGVIYGIFLYKQNLTVKRITICVIVEGIITTLILTPIWLSILYGSKIFALARIVRFFIMIPIKVILIYVIAKFLKKNNIISNKI